MLMDMTRRWKQALITGASSGIGREMARILAAEGTDLVVVARDTDRLNALAEELSTNVEVITADLGDLTAVDAVADRIADDSDPIDLLVNNAGLGYTGDFIDISDERRRLMTDVNVVALQELSYAAAKAMVRRGGGTILNVSSIAGDVPSPATATYNATKAFVTSLSQSMNMELTDHKVTVSCLCPGLTRTEFQERAEYDATGLPDLMWQSANQVAQVGLDAAAKGRAVVVPGLLNKTVSRLVRSTPRGVARWSAGALGRRQ